jgi:DNA-binding transcriptional LysR family regulator
MTVRHPDLADLELLLDVARSGSIGRAAAEHRLSQPTVSRRMVALERALRVPLLSRSRRGSVLTPAGRVVVDWASALLQAAEDFTTSVAALRDTRATTVRAAVSMTIAEHHAPRWLARLRQGGPGLPGLPELSVSLEVHNSTDVADLVESGEVDIGFVESPSVRRTVRRRRVGWDRLVVAVPPEHPWAGRRREVSAEELAAARVLVREPGSGTRETLENALRAAGTELVAGAVLGSNAALKSAAVAGIGPVVLSHRALAGELAAGSLREVPVGGLSLRRPLWAIWRRDESLSDGASALLRVASSGSAGISD